MARTKPKVLKLKKQRRYAVHEIKMKELNSEAHRRSRPSVALDIYKEREYPVDPNTGQPSKRYRLKTVVVPLKVDLDTQYSNARRVMYGLGEIDTPTAREEVLAKLKDVSRFAECIFSVENKRMYMIYDRREDGYYFIYRELGVYYKKSLVYKNRSKAMDRYNNERITWVKVVTE